MSNLIYCPVCGHILGQRVEGGRMRQACESCGYVHYVNPVPAVGLLIEMEGGLVLIRRGQPPHQGEWTLPSGFVEADESAEEAAVREAEEETGLKVKIIEMAGINSFPEGPPVSGIMIFYRLQPISGTLVGGDDAIEAKVFQAHELPPIPFRTHREMVAHWLGRQAAQPPLPIAPVTSDFSIRAAEVRDAEQVMGLLALIPANRDLSDEDWRGVMQRFRESAGIEMFVAESQQPPIILGFIALSVVRTLTGGRGFINDMAVLPTYQRRGVGAALLEAVVRRADRLNLQTLMVNAERANSQAKSFYAACGFSEEGILHFRMK